MAGLPACQIDRRADISCPEIPLAGSLTLPVVALIDIELLNPDEWQNHTTTPTNGRRTLFKQDTLQQGQHIGGFNSLTWCPKSEGNSTPDGIQQAAPPLNWEMNLFFRRRVRHQDTWQITVSRNRPQSRVTG